MPRLSVLLAGGGGEGGPVGGEGEGGPVGGEGEGGRLGLFSSPLPGLFSSPHPGLFSPPPWYSRPDYRSDCRSRRWGDTRARRRYARPGGVGMGGGRAAAAVPPSPALTSPSCFSSNQPVSLRGGGGGSALGRRVRARAARDLFREGTVGRVSISRARTIFHVISSTAFDAFARTASGGGRTGSRFEPGPFGSRFGTRLEGCFALAERARARGCVCACAAARRGEARRGAARRGEAGGGGARSFLLPG